MFVARLICSEEDCASEHEVEAASLDELEALACDCGCVLEIIGWPDWAGERAAMVIALPPRDQGAAPHRYAA